MTIHKNELELQPKNLPGGGKAIVSWCRPLWLQGAHPRRPLRLEVSTPVRAPGPTGMPEGAEVTALENLEFLLTRLVTRRAQADHAMTVTGGGEQVFVFYLAARCGLFRTKDTRATLAPLLEQLGAREGRSLGVTWADDPGWTRLLGLFEAHDPAQWKTDHALMIHMAKANDAIHARRTVAHRLYFTDRDGCRDFLRDVRRLKFKADGGPKEEADGRLVVLVERLEPTIATFHLHPVVLSVKVLAAAHGGVYHGWETDLIPSRTPPPLMPGAPPAT